MYGGKNIVAEKNLVRAAQPVAGIQVSTGHNAWPFESVIVRNNWIVDSGGVNWKQKFGSIWVHSPGAVIDGAVIEGNTVLGGQNDAVKLQGGNTISLLLKGNRVIDTTGDGVRILGNVRGNVTLDGNRFDSVGGQPLRNDAGKAVQLAEKK